MKELGPNEGMNALRHPDCRFCDEYEGLIRGVAEENRQLKARLANIGQGGLAMQCPGCFSVQMYEEVTDGYECACGERLTVIDLRGEKRYGSLEEIKRVFFPNLHAEEQREAQRSTTPAGVPIEPSPQSLDVVYAGEDQFSELRRWAEEQAGEAQSSADGAAANGDPCSVYLGQAEAFQAVARYLREGMGAGQETDVGVGADLLKPDEASRNRGDGPGVSADSSVQAPGLGEECP